MAYKYKIFTFRIYNKDILINKIFILYIKIYLYGDWGLGIGDWGIGKTNRLVFIHEYA